VDSFPGGTRHAVAASQDLRRRRGTGRAYRGKTHQACSTCVEVLIEHEKEPYPRPPGHPSPATRVRNGPNGRTWHCARHGEALERKDREIKARLTTMREHREHVSRSRR
jgi:hypothetical protein